MMQIIQSVNLGISNLQQPKGGTVFSGNNIINIVLMQILMMVIHINVWIALKIPKPGKMLDYVLMITQYKMVTQNLELMLKYKVQNLNYFS